MSSAVVHSDERRFRDAWRRMRAGLPWCAVATVGVAMPALANGFKGEGLLYLAVGFMGALGLMASPLIVAMTVAMRRSGWTAGNALSVFIAILIFSTLLLGPGMLFALVAVVPIFAITWACTAAPLDPVTPDPRTENPPSPYPD
jgi:hypothetical protein